MGQNTADQPRPVIIEFLGAPGSGKSTLSHRVARILRGMGLIIKEPSYELDHQKDAVVRKSKKLYKAIKHLITRPVVSVRSFSEIIRSDQRHMKETAKLAIHLLYVSECYEECKRRNGVYLFDQGFFQWLCSTLYSAQNPSTLESGRIYRMIRDSIEQSVCLVISVHAEPAIAMARMAQRGGSASRVEQIEDKAELSENLLLFYCCLLETERKISDWAEKSPCAGSGPLLILKINNDDGISLENNETLIAGSIYKLVSG